MITRDYMETKDKKTNDNVLIHSKQGSTSGGVTLQQVLKQIQNSNTKNDKGKK